MSHKIIETGDGSHTLFVEELNEHYHSIHGSTNEALHVFVNSALLFHENLNLKVLEIGFGTGLNALLSVINSRGIKTSVQYNSIEKYPVKENVFNRLNFGRANDEEDLFHKLHSCDWEVENQIEDHFYLRKLKMDLDELNTKNTYDVVFFDAFAPNKQPNLWTIEIFKRVFHSMKQSGIFVTYCAKGQVRRDLIESGFEVERIAGPPGKREMLRAFKR